MPALPPEAVEKIRAAILAEPRGRNPEACLFLMEHVLGFGITKYVRAWVYWTLRNIRTVNLAKRGLGKSFAKVGVDIYWICCDPNVTILTISKVDEKAEECNAPVRASLERNALLKQLFGTFVGRAAWRDGFMIVAQRTNHLLREATLTATGIEGQIAGGHWDHVWIDDGQDEDRSKSETLTDRDWTWLSTTLRGALRERGTIHFNATPYTWMDLPTRLEDFVNPKTGEAKAEVFHIEDVWDGDYPPPSARWRILKTPAKLRDGSSIDPDRFPLEDQILEDGEVIEGLNSLEGLPGYETQQLMEKPEKPESGARWLIFKRAHMKPWEREPARAGLRIVQFFDPSWVSAETAAALSSRERDPDYFAIATLGYELGTGMTNILDVYMDRADTAGKLKAAGALRAKWRPNIYGCEKTNLQVRMPGALEFYKGIAAAVGMRVIFVAPQKKKAVRWEVLATACARDRVRWNPAILARSDVMEQFGAAGDPDEAVHDDAPDACAGGYLLIRGRAGGRGEVVEERRGGDVPPVTGRGFAAVPRSSGGGSLGGGFASVPRRR